MSNGTVGSKAVEIAMLGITIYRSSMRDAAEVFNKWLNERLKHSFFASEEALPAKVTSREVLQELRQIREILARHAALDIGTKLYDADEQTRVSFTAGMHQELLEIQLKALKQSSAGFENSEQPAESLEQRVLHGTAAEEDIPF